MFKSILQDDLNRAVKALGFPQVDIVCSIPENNRFGDYTTNVALQLSKLKSKIAYHSAKEIANKILENLGHPPYLERAEVAGPGFLNFFLKDESLLKNLSMDTSFPKKEPSAKEKNKRYIVEFADPNAYKLFHIGHLRPLILGESLARLLEYQGAKVYRTNYGSDIGPTVGKTLWGIGKKFEEYQQVQEKSLREKAKFLGEVYAFAHKEYEEKEEDKKEIDEITKKLYLRDPEILPLWDKTKEWSYAYLDTIYARFKTEFDRVIRESEVEKEGKEIVLENVGKIFVEDEGAIIFPGEKYGLHNRVFITSAGNPTYEAKELGLTRLYQEHFQFDELIILSDIPQAGFFKVVIKAMELIDKKLEGKKHHHSFGSVGLSTGKMSSRSGNVIAADDFIDTVKVEIKNGYGKGDSPTENLITEMVAVGAVKFAMLKYSSNSDISLDIKNSISLQGDTGPYVQYTYARTQSVLGKSTGSSPKASGEVNLEPEEREVLRMLEHFDYYIYKAIDELSPTNITEYLLNLAKAFNLFYQKHPILKTKEESFRLDLTKKVGETIKQGLYLLGIDSPERM